MYSYSKKDNINKLAILQNNNIPKNQVNVVQTMIQSFSKKNYNLRKLQEQLSKQLSLKLKKSVGVAITQGNQKYEGQAQRMKSISLKITHNKKFYRLWILQEQIKVDNDHFKNL